MSELPWRTAIEARQAWADGAPVMSGRASPKPLAEGVLASPRCCPPLGGAPAAQRLFAPFASSQGRS